MALKLLYSVKAKHVIRLYMLFMLFIYTGATTKYPNQHGPLSIKRDEYISPSKVILSLLHDYLHKCYCVTLENY